MPEHSTDSRRTFAGFLRGVIGAAGEKLMNVIFDMCDMSLIPIVRDCRPWQ